MRWISYPVVFVAVCGLATKAGAEAPDGSLSLANLMPLPLEPVVIYGDRQEADPGSYAVLDAEAVSRLRADHPAEALNALPGVNIQMNSGQEHLISLRSPVLTGGAGQGSFLILENGVPTRSPAFGNVNSLIEPHHETASAIEVVRGPGSAKYGSNAVHGLINVILADSGSLDRSALTVSYGSLQRYRGDLVSKFGEGSVVSLSAQKDLGWRDFTDISQQKLSAVHQFTFGSWQATGWISGSNLEQETAGFIQGAKAYRDRDVAESNPNPEAFRNAWSARAALRLSRSLAGGELVVTPFFRSQEMEFRQHFLPYRGFEENGHDGAGVQARFERQASERLIWAVGADADLASGFLIETQPEPFGFFPGDTRFPVGIHYDYDVDTTKFALWSELDFAVNSDVRLITGLRSETHSYDYTTDAPPGINGRFNVPENREDDFDLLTPKLGIIWTPRGGDISYFANYARGERVPQASDLYRLQSRQVAGEVEAETLDSLEVGARGTLHDQLTFDVAAYWMTKENFFFRDADGLNVPDGETEHLGVEVAFDWALPVDTLSLAGTLTWSEQTYAFDRIVGNGSEVIRDGNRIDTAPEWLGDLALVWTPSATLRAQLEVEHVGEYFTNPANTRDYPGHTVFHARANWQVGGGLEAFAIIRNLFDLNYADRADFAFGNERYFPGEPLNITLGLRRQFGG